MKPIKAIAIVTSLVLASGFASLAKEQNDGRPQVPRVQIPTSTANPQPEFEPALPGYTFAFPRDHGMHDTFKTEWWYFTGHLETDAGRYGFELTFFRVGVSRPSSPPDTVWDLRNLALAHFAITDINGRKFRYYEKLNRFSPFTAGARAESLNVFNEGWSVTTTADGAIRIRAAAAADAIDFTVTSQKPPAIHGENGVSIKAEGKGYASHYYSLTRMVGSGTVIAGGKRQPCTVLAWMDHEFGSSSLRESQAGWDWFSVQLDNRTELMLYQIRRRNGQPDTTSSGSFVLVDGTVIPIRQTEFRVTPLGRWRSAESGAVYPMGWEITVAPLNLKLRLREDLQDQELLTRNSTGVTYWEGSVDASGSFGGTPVRGAGYVELTGYDKPFVAP
ncbi:MAG: lipocalin-like domain-containing protein [Acidobacteriota bacterium]